MSDNKITVFMADPSQAPTVVVDSVGKEYYLRANSSAVQAEMIKTQVEALDHILYVGTTQPTLSNVYAWINPEEDEDFAVSMEEAIQAAKDAKDYAEIAESYVLPKATTTTLGAIKVGSNLSVDANGVLSATADLTNYYTKTQVDQAITTALANISNGDEVSY